MDVVHRLRIVIWVLILGLWGIMVYQFLGDEEADRKESRMASIGNPYKGIPLPEAPPEPTASTPPTVDSPSADPLTLARQAALAAQALQARPEEAAPPPGPAGSLDYVKPLPPSINPPAPRLASRPRPQGHGGRLRHELGLRNPDPPIPPGFVKTITRHFNIYSEGDPPSEDFLGLLENLHGNLMLDLAAFSPWADDQRVSIFLFRSQQTYREVTGRPAWSGGASSVPKRKVYVYESEELPSILAHELTHIYYDGFYLDGHADPLWLSEGMATLVQVERGLAAPNWLLDNMKTLENGGGFPIEQLMAVTTTADQSDEQVKLWYAQSYSLVRFLIRSQHKASFYKFSEYLREGKDPTQALYRSYGMPFNRLKALEYAWRYELANSASRQVSRSEADNF